MPVCGEPAVEDAGDDLEEPGHPGRHAVEAGYRVYYTTAADLVAKTQRAVLEGRW